MAKIFGQLEKAQLENTTSDTASHPKGMVTYRTDLNQAKVSNGTDYKLLIDEDSTQTLSNKTLASPKTTGAFTAAQTTTPANPSSGENKFYFKADGKMYTLDSAGNESAVGSGTGGVKNLITNGNADDTSSSIFVPYADSGTRPVDGTGGSPTVTTSMTSSTPLDGAKSFLLTKPASNVQGQGWAVPLTVDPAYRAKALKISVDYIVKSGTFVAGSSTTESDVIWYIYDVTNSQLIEPSSIKMFSNSSLISSKFEATFQSSATGSSYRLIAHVQSVSALAYELEVDNITVGPSAYVYGSPVTDPVLYTPSFTGFGTPTSLKINQYRVGKYLYMEGTFVSGTVSAVQATVSLPSGLTIDSNVMTSSFYSVVGQDSGTGAGSAFWVLGRGGDTTVSFSGGANSLNPQTATTLFASSQNISFWAKIPITGWSASTQMSSDAGVAETYFSATKIAGSFTAATNVSGFTTILKDAGGSWNNTTGVFTVQSPGDFYTSLKFSANTGNNISRIYKNGVAVASGDGFNSNGLHEVTGVVTGCKAGDTITIQPTANTGTLSSGAGDNVITIYKINQGQQTIAASETISASYWMSANQTTSTQLNFDSKEYDSHGAVTTGASWKFTAPTPGLYQVSGHWYTSSGNTSLRVYKNGTAHKTVSSILTTLPGDFCAMVKLLAGDYIDLRPSGSVTIQGGLLDGIATNTARLEIIKVGL